MDATKAAEYPKMLYAGGKDPVTVNDRAEQDGLDGKWFDKPDFTNHDEDHLERNVHTATRGSHVYREYPKMLYSPGQEPIIVNNQAEEEALDGDWFDNPNCDLKAPSPDEPGKKLTAAEKKAEAKRQREAEEAAKDSGEKPGKTPPVILSPQTKEEIERNFALNPSGLDVTGRARADAENARSAQAAEAQINADEQKRAEEAKRQEEADKDKPDQTEPSEAEIRKAKAKDAEDLL